MSNDTMQGRLIKVHITLGGESFWALLANENDRHCVVKNVLLDPNVTLDDVIEISRGIEANGDYPWEFVKVIEKKRNSAYIKYSDKGDKEAVTKRFRAIAKYLRQKDIMTEGMIAGMATIAYPVSMNETHLKTICGACVRKIELKMPEIVEDNNE